MQIAAWKRVRIRLSGWRRCQRMGQRVGSFRIGNRWRGRWRDFMSVYTTHPECRAPSDVDGIISWHMNEFESAAMWQLYANFDEGIAIRSTYKRLRDCFWTIVKHLVFHTEKLFQCQ